MSDAPYKTDSITERSPHHNWIRWRHFRTLKYFIILGLSSAILTYLGNSIFVSEKRHVIQQHLIQAQLIAHLGAISMAYTFGKIGNGQKIIISFLEHKQKWRFRNIKPLLQSYLKTNRDIIKWAGLSEINGKVLLHYPHHSPLPFNIHRILSTVKIPGGNTSLIKILYQRHLILIIHPVKKPPQERYIFWCIGSFNNFLHGFTSIYRGVEGQYIWLVFKTPQGQKALYMDNRLELHTLKTTFPLPITNKELTYKGKPLLVGAHPFRLDGHDGWFIVGIPKKQIEVQLSEFRNKGMVLTGFFVIFFSIFLYTYFKNRSRRIVAERTANISREILISKQQLESYIENSSDAILRNDLDGRIQFINPTFTRIFGWEAREVVGKNIKEIFPDDRAKIERVIETIKAKKPFPPYETRRRRKDGQILDLYVSASPILNSHGEVISITAVYRDHTRLKRLEDRLYQSEKMAAIGQLVAQIAHEINNPLSTLQFSLQLLRRAKQDGPDFMEEIEDMDEEIRRIARIVNQLLSFSRPQSKRKRQASMRRVFKNKMLQLLLKNLRERGVEVSVDFPESLPMVRVYSDQMLQVFMNLIQNAGDSIDENGKISIRARAKIQDYEAFYQLPARAGESNTPVGKVVEIVVSDTGKGIPQEMLPHIFEPFFTSKGTNGTGLGLSIVHSIISRAGGSIDVESTPGRGTQFTIILPAVEQQHPRRDKRDKYMVQTDKQSNSKKIEIEETNHASDSDCR